MWAYATLGVQPGPRCLDALAGFAGRNLPDFSPQNISNSCWAMATLQFKPLVTGAICLSVTVALSSIPLLARELKLHQFHAFSK